MAAIANAMRDDVSLLVFATLLVAGIVNADDGSLSENPAHSSGGVAWRLPVPRGREGCGDRESAGSCVTVLEGDSAALLAALSDSGVDEIWLAGGVSVPQGSGVLHLERDLLIGGLSQLTPLHFEAGDGETLLVNHGFVAIINLQLIGFAAFKQSLGLSRSNVYNAFGVVELLHLAPGDRLPTMAPFPQEWIPAKDGGVCTNGLAFYNCDTALAKGGLLDLLFSPAEMDVLTMEDLFATMEEHNLGNAQLNDLISFENHDENQYGQSGFHPTYYSGFYSELIPLDGLPCGYAASSTITLSGHAEIGERLPSAATLHDGRTILETECQTRQSTPGGKDYGGNLNVTYSGKACVPWKDLDLFDLDMSYIEGNSCRNPGGSSHGVYCFVESDAAAREVADEASIRQPPRFFKEACGVPECGLQSTQDCQWKQDNGMSYTGSINVTQAGNECLPWLSVWASYQTFGPDNNSCRNAERQGKSVWCYTSNDMENGHTKQLCDVPICEGVPVPRRRETISIDELYPSWSSAGVPGRQQEPPPPPPPLDVSSGLETKAGISARVLIIAGLSSAAILSVLVAMAVMLNKRLLFRRAPPSNCVVRVDELGIGKDLGMEASVHGENIPSSHGTVSASSRGQSSRRPCSRVDPRTSVSLQRSHESLSKISTLSKDPISLGLVKTHEIIGAGFTSQVWRCTWMGLEVACKVMQLDAVPEKVQNMLLQGVEGSLVGELSHPNIIRTFQIYHVSPLESSVDSAAQRTDLSGTASVGMVAEQADRDVDSSLIRGGRERGVEQLWVVQELCRGGDLGQAIYDKRFLEGRERKPLMFAILRVLEQIALALKYLHDAGIVHGDLKCENVLMDKCVSVNEANIKVTDFGLAHAMPDNQDYYTSAHVIGDYTYMAPEALLDNKVSTKMDTYSFGLISYELVSGNKVPRAGTAMRHAAMLEAGERPEFPDGMHNGLQELAQACWERKPEDRPSDDLILFKLSEIIRDVKMQSLQGGDDQMTLQSPVQLSSLEPVSEAVPSGYICPPTETQAGPGAIRGITGLVD